LFLTTTKKKNHKGQALGLIIAESFQQAVAAAKKVKVGYKNMKKPVLTIEDAIAAQSFYPKPCDDFVYGDAEGALAKSPHVTSGRVSISTQYHFYMESQVAVCEQHDYGYLVESSTQWPDLVQKGIAQVLGIKNSSCIDVKVYEVGGAYGGKITRASWFLFLFILTWLNFQRLSS
jgi:xanthine dehydrogenase/oxidase